MQAVSRAPLNKALGFMDYAALIARAISNAPTDPSLAEILWRVDAMNKSVPTFEELITAFDALAQNGHSLARSYLPVTREEYEDAVASNHEHARDLLRKQGIPGADVDAILRRYVTLMQKNET
jgi:hypothetical protein